jgi:hypothetical protein
MPGRKPHQFTLLELDVIATALAQGWSKRRIAGYLGVWESIIRRFLIRNPRIAEPDDFEIVIPPHLTPRSRPTPIRDGDAAYCAVSDKTGVDGHPRLQRDHRTDPKPDKKPPDTKPKAKPTRREKRKQAVI